MLMVSLLETLHIIAALCRIPLYTRAELRSWYMRGIYFHTELQIAMTYVLAIAGVVVSVMNVCITFNLVHACQDLHSNVHVVLSYD